MTVPGFGRITPVQAAVLRLAGYRLTRLAEQSVAPMADGERLAIMKEGLNALRRSTGADFGYDIEAWEVFLLANSEEYRHRYALAATRRRVAAALADHQRKRLVAAHDDQCSPSALGVAVRVVAASAGEDRAARFGDGSRDVLVVADGAGGSGAGGAAADALVDHVRRALWAADLAEVLRDADHALATSKHGGETTAVVARVADGRVVGASVGERSFERR